MATRGKSAATSKKSSTQAKPIPVEPKVEPKVKPKAVEEPELDKPEKGLAESIYSTFVEHAGWGYGDTENKEKVFKEWDELIAKHHQLIKQLEQQKLDFDNRGTKAREFIDAMIEWFGPTANEEAILQTVYVRFDVAPPKRTRTKAAPKPIDEGKKQAVLDVLDGEGMLSGDIRKALPEGVDMDSATLKQILDSLIADKRVDKSGERRSTSYRRLDAGAPEPPPPPTVDPDDEPDGIDPGEPDDESENEDENGEYEE